MTTHGGAIPVAARSRTVAVMVALRLEWRVWLPPYLQTRTGWCALRMAMVMVTGAHLEGSRHTCPRMCQSHHGGAISPRARPPWRAAGCDVCTITTHALACVHPSHQLNPLALQLQSHSSAVPQPQQAAACGGSEEGAATTMHQCSLMSPSWPETFRGRTMLPLLLLRRWCAAMEVRPMMRMMTCHSWLQGEGEATIVTPSTKPGARLWTRPGMYPLGAQEVQWRLFHRRGTTVTPHEGAILAIGPGAISAAVDVVEYQARVERQARPPSRRLMR
mmetsp:Transcript_9514/g.25894  ORF Transcript_9514/g.25894 Transcript_9514/m.25894 type:complete len:275 (+) Transcript_9514:155-979(+)